MKPADSRRILIIKLSSIGDVVMATPVAQALRTALPDAYLAWVVEEKSKDIVIGNPYLDEVIVWHRNSSPPGGSCARGRHFLHTLRDLTSELRGRRFDAAIDLQGLLRSALVGWMSGARYRLGFDGSREGAWLFYNLPQSSVVTDKVRCSQHYLNVLRPIGIVSDEVPMYMPVSDDDRAFARELLAEVRNRQSGGRLAALCPATTWPNKHWTEEGWADLADGLVRDWDMLPMFMGAHADIPMIDRIRDRAGCETFNLAGRTTLKQAAAMLEQSDLVVGVDTGLLHIAVALNRPGIGIFGPSGWQHFVIRDTFMPLAKEFPCIPCFRHPTCRDYDCMKAITPQDVLQAVHQLFDRTRHVHGEKAVVDPGQDRGCNET